MTLDVKPLMEDKAIHWTELAPCGGDDRFTARLSSLTDGDLADMERKCADCPVVKECESWADREKAVEVYVAGYWRDEYWWIERERQD